MKKVKIGFIVAFIALSFQLFSQEQVTPSAGKTTEQTPATLTSSIQKPFEYIPVSPDFWAQVTTLRTEKKWDDIIKKVRAQHQSYGEVTPEGFEALLARAMVLEELGFPLSAFEIYLDAVREQKGSNIAAFAIERLGLMAVSSDYDVETLMELFDSYETESLHPDLLDFASFFKGLNNARYGHRKWAEEEFGKIQKDKNWDHLRQYWTALAYIAQDQMTKAEPIMRALFEKPALQARTRDLVTLQLARIEFEKGNFNEALRLYDIPKNFGYREKGRQLLEKAWTLFYLGEFGRSLGVLHALKAPIFSSSLNPEVFILEMLIFRQLCHFELVEYSRDIFNKKFGSTIDYIQKRSDLKKNQHIFNLSVMNLNIQPLVNLVGQIQIEIAAFDKDKIFDGREKAQIKDQLRRRSQNYQARIDLQLNTLTRDSASQILKSQEQIKFIEYVSSLDALKLSDDLGAVSYEAQKISKVRFEQIFWPVTSEYWFDELESYRMQISSICQTTTDSDEKKLEESFE